MRLVLSLLSVLLAASASAQDACTDLGTLRGVVTDAETGQPVVGAGVAIPALRLGTVTQRDGSFALACVPAGAHDVRAVAYRYHPVTTEVRVGEAFDVALVPGAEPGCAAIHEHGAGGRPVEPEGGR